MKKIFLLFVVALSFISCSKNDPFVKEEEIIQEEDIIKLSDSELMLSIGDFRLLTYGITPISSANKAVLWNSSNPNVVSVDKGSIKALEEGEAIITVEIEETAKKSSCKVIVDANELGHNTNSGTLTMDAISDIDNVSVWEKETEIILNDYYSQIETITNRVITREIRYYCGENEDVSVKWLVNGVVQIDTESHKIWRGDLQKWLVINVAVLNVDGITENLKIETIVQFSDNNVRRCKIIPKISINKNVSDAFGFTFGTPRVEMNDVIGLDISPQFSTLGILSFPSNDKPIAIFEFSNGKLIRVYAVNDEPFFTTVNLSQVSQKCKIPESLQFAQNNHLAILNPQEWTVGTLKLKVFNTTLSTLWKRPGYNDTERAFLSIENQ